MEGDDVLGLSAAASGSYMGEELVGRYLQVEGFGVAEAAYPHVLNNCKNKLAGKLLYPLYFSWCNLLALKAASAAIRALALALAEHVL